MDDVLTGLQNLLSSVEGGDTLSIATNATGEIQITSLSALLSSSSGTPAPATTGLMAELGIEAALIVRDASGNILWQSGAIPPVNPAYAVFGIGALAFVIWLLVR